MAEENNLEEILKPFYQRASETQDRLARLEAAIATKRNSGIEELIKTVDDLRSELKDVKAEQAAEGEKAQKELQQLAAENARLQYRIGHLVRALKEADYSSTSKWDASIHQVTFFIETSGHMTRIRGMKEDERKAATDKQKPKSKPQKGQKNGDPSSPFAASPEFDDPQIKTDEQHQRPKRLKRPTKSVNEYIEPAFTASPSVLQEGSQNLIMAEVSNPHQSS